MNTEQVIILARKHIANNPENEASARLCLADAVELQGEGKLAEARNRAVKSLQYSVGIFHADYRRVSPK